MHIAEPYFFVKVKLAVPLLCVCVYSAWKGHPRNDLCCVGWDVKPYSVTHSLFCPKWAREHHRYFGDCENHV